MTAVWVLVGTFGALIGFAALVDRRRYRGVQVPAHLTRRERRVGSGLAGRLVTRPNPADGSDTKSAVTTGGLLP